MGNEYDDPYSFLAFYLISVSLPSEIRRMLVDDDFIRRMVIKEIRGQDFIGPFCNCIIDEILRNKQRMEMCHELDALAEYFFTKLDLDRLRRKIIQYATTYSIITV